MQQQVPDSLLAALHEAAIDETRWPRASALIDDAFGARGNGLILGRAFEEGMDVFSARFYSGGRRRTYLERVFLDLCASAGRGLPGLEPPPADRVAPVPELLARKCAKPCRASDDGLARLGMQDGLMARIDGPNALRAIWVLADPVRAKGWDGARRLDLAERLLPHLRHFVLVRQGLTEAAALGQPHSGLQEAAQIGLIHLDRLGRIIKANARAGLLLERGDHLFERAGFLRLGPPADCARFEEVLERVLQAPRTRNACGSMTLTKPFAGSRLVLILRPAPATLLNVSTIAAVVRVVEPLSWPRVDDELVCEALRLTPTQGRVAALLCNGASVREIAALTGRKEASIRWQLKNVLKRLGLSRQPELVRLVSSLANLGVSKS